MNIIERVSDEILKASNADFDNHVYYHFEPWDVAKRTEEQLSRAADDGIDLYDSEFVKHTGADPHPFQVGYLLSKKTIRILLGGSQIGKSICPRTEMMMMTTGNIPYSLRYKAGVDTGIPRLVTTENILRFGRLDSRTGKIIDRNWKAFKDEKEWNCGNIEGVGIWPTDKIAPEGSQIWIGTLTKAKDNYWWPNVADNRYNDFPTEFINKSRGNKGTNKSEGIVHMQRNCSLVFLTYEMGHRRFEAIKAWTYIADEEMPYADIWASAQDHSHTQSLVMTPLDGITWSKKLLLPDKKNPYAELFHATQYDSPYQDNKEVDARRRTQEQWQRAARVWGLYAEQKGEPYYDRNKINIWMNRFRKNFEYVRFEPAEVYFGMKSKPEIVSVPGLLDTNIKMTRVDSDNQVNTWRLYEDLKPGVGYLFTADLAEGAPTPDEAGDVSAGRISRKPIEEKKEIKPITVATIRSTQEVMAFARTSSFALRYFNNALLASETGRGSANTAFQCEIDEWPYWFHTTVTRDSTGRQREKKGFDINQSSRDMIFELIGDWLGEFDEDEYPYIPDEPLLKELAAAVVGVTRGGKKRCDHPRDGTLDSAVEFGIMCYVFKNCIKQIKCNIQEEPVQERFSRIRTNNSPKVVCGMSAMGYKEM